MKNKNDINSSLSEIKKVLTEDDKKNQNIEEKDFFLLKNLIKKGDKLKQLENSKDVNDFTSIKIKKEEKKNKIIKKNKLKKIRLSQVHKADNKSSIDNVINKEIKPIIKNWINKNLRKFVKRIVFEEFKVISKAAFKQKSITK
tara:strand:- start:2699 stop:3127 length:429 start_codon:yes stop_codon:yes gene_type:complete